MYSINFTVPSVATFGTSGCAKPCNANRDMSWCFRTNHCFILEVFQISEQTGEVKSIMKIQCVGYKELTPEVEKLFRDRGYGNALDEIKSVQTPAPMQAVAIVDQIVVDRDAPMGGVIDTFNKFHCVICQGLARAFGDHKFFGWYMNWQNIMPTVKSIINTFMPEYKTGDILYAGNFYYKIPKKQMQRASEQMQAQEEPVPSRMEEQVSSGMEVQIPGQGAVVVAVLDSIPRDLGEIISQLRIKH